MDLEQLTKHQIVLLTLLVSFVTSIATGIITVSLMNQAPPSVTHTINQIVERTVDTVTPASQPTTITTQKTVVVDNSQLAAQAIAAAQQSVIRIVAKGGDKLIARGVIVSKNGEALTDAEALNASGASSFEALLPGDERVPVTLPKSPATSTSLFAVQVAVGTTTGWAPAALADPASLALGAAVIRIGGVGADSVAEGVISTLPQPGSRDIEASVSASTPGSALITLSGALVGLSTGPSQQLGTDFYTVAGAVATSTQATQSAS